MLTQLTGQDLPQWISYVKAAGLPGLSSFAKGLKQDLDAVTQGLTSRWNSGPVEGRVNLILRCSNGRCSAEPDCRCSRKRVLLTARD
jgi:transposase